LEQAAADGAHSVSGMLPLWYGRVDIGKRGEMLALVARRGSG